MENLELKMENRHLGVGAVDRRATYSSYLIDERPKFLLEKSIFVLWMAKE